MPNRRDFLRLAASYLAGLAGVLGLAGTARFLTYDGPPTRKADFDLGPAADYPMGARVVVEAVPALVIHDEGGISAMSLVCTHLGCTVDEALGGFECACHGSRYDETGAVRRGPATAALHRLRTEVTSDGRLVLHAG